MTTKSKTNKLKRKSAGFNLMAILIIIGIIALAFTFYIGYRASISDRKIFSVSLIALFAGLIYESYRVSNSWKKVGAIFIGSYFISLFNFLPGKREHIYIIENHIESWPYAFIVFFAILFVSFNKEKVTAKLTEGVTLLLSVSVIYWCFDYGFTNYDNWFAITLLSIIFVFSAFSILNAFTSIQLTRTNRLALSIWSTIIMFAFAVDNIFRVFSNQDIDTTIYLSEGLYIGLQYFLLGVSAVYIMQNYLLLTEFLPSRNGNYKNDLKENKKDHIDRFSEKQVLVWQSLFCLIYSTVIYGLNYKYQILPGHTMIWLVFLTFSIILELVQILNRRKIDN